LAVLVLIAPGRWSHPEVARSQDAPAPAGYTRLQGQMPSILSQGTPAGAVPAGQLRTLAVVLASSDPAGLAAFVRATSDPASPTYQKWLTADAWSAQFGPTVDTEAAVANYLSQGGLTILDEAPNRQVIRASGTVATINQLLQITLTTYNLPGGSTIVAPDQDPAVPAGLVADILAISGLTGQATPGATPYTLPPEAQTAGLRPVVPADIQQAYQLDQLTAKGFDGTGETVAILAISTTNQSDLGSYASEIGLAPFNLEVVSMPPSGPPPDPVLEYTLDPTAVHAAAPGAKILMYELDCSAEIPACIILLLNRVASDDRADVMTKSLDSCEPVLPKNEVLAREQIYEAAAAEGITSLSASGDDGPYCTARYNAALMQPSVHLYPSAVNVGGTTLSTGPGGHETGWPGSGGGESMYFPTPGYQTGAGTPTDGKEGGPDVAADASPKTGLWIIFGGQPVATFGTSLAAPLWAGVQAVVNQARGGSRRGQVLYDYYQRPQAFHQITEGSTGLYTAHPGWNYVTGLGTPNAVALAGQP